MIEGDFHIRSKNGWWYIENLKGDVTYASHLTERQVGEWFKQYTIERMKESSSD